MPSFNGKSVFPDFPRKQAFGPEKSSTSTKGFFPHRSRGKIEFEQDLIDYIA